MAASETGAEEIVSLLIDAGADVNAVTDCDRCRGETALTITAEYSHASVVERRLQSGADKTQRTSGGRTALDFAVQENYEPVIQLLHG